MGFLQGWSLGGLRLAKSFPTFYLIGCTLCPFSTVRRHDVVSVIIDEATLALAATLHTFLTRNLWEEARAELALASLASLNPWTDAKYHAVTT